MGAKPSKSSPAAAGVGVGAGFGLSDFQYTAELTSYEEECHLDPELRSFDAGLQQRTSHVISALAGGVELGSLSLATLRAVTDGLLETNREVVHLLLQYRQDIWRNPELFALADDYFDCSSRTLDYCTQLEKCLRKARDSHLLIHFALNHQFEEEDENKHAKALEKLRQFKTAGNPFTAEFSEAFHSVHRQHKSMLEKLLRRKKKLDKKLKSIRSWRRLSNAIFVAALAAVIVCSVVAASVAGPHVAAAMAAAAAVPVGSVGKWVDSLLRRYQVAVEGEERLISSMQTWTLIALGDLDSIRVMAEELENHFESLLGNAEFATGRDEEALGMAAVEIRKKMEVLTRDMDELVKQVDVCSRVITKARWVVLERIWNYPG